MASQQWHSPFAVLLKRHRLAIGLTQEELAKRARVSARAISALERGVNERPHWDTVGLLAVALGLTPGERTRFEAAARGRSEAAVARGCNAFGASWSGVPLVGRSRELQQIESHLGGEGPPVLLLVGEPGIGKTSLLREAAKLGHTVHTTVLWGGCQRRSGQQPYSPLLEALARHVEQQPRPQLRAALQDCAWLVRLLPELGEIAAVPAGTLAPEQERRLVFRAVGKYLENVAGPGGTLVVLDDLQWAGSAALDLLLAVVQSGDTSPLRVVAAYRQTEVTAGTPLATAIGEMAHRDLARQLLLGPLNREEAAELLDHLLFGEGGIGPAIREQLVERAEGIPFFLVSLAQALRAGALSESGGALPWSIAESIREQVAALSAAGQEVLGVAAVAGRVVSRPVLMEVVAQPEEETVAALEVACRAGLLREKGIGAYRVAHDVIREVIEADLGAARRAVLHRQIAETLEKLPERERERRAGELAWHFREAGDAGRSLQYSLIAGDQAEAVFAHREAEQHFHTALDLVREQGDELREAAVLERLGAVLTLEAKYEEARTALEQAAEMYRSAGDLERLGYVTAAIGGVYVAAGWTSVEALERLRRLIEALQSSGPLSAVPGLYARLAALLFLSGRYPDQLAAAERGMAVAAQLGDQRLAPEAEYYRAFALFLLGQLVLLR